MYSQQWAVIWVHLHMTICTPYIYLCHSGARTTSSDMMAGRLHCRL